MKKNLALFNLFSLVLGGSFVPLFMTTSCAPTPDPEPDPDPTSMEDFYKIKDTANDFDECYDVISGAPGVGVSWKNESGYYKEPKNIIYPTKIPSSGEKINFAPMFTWSAINTIDLSNKITENIIFPWTIDDREEGKTISIDSYCLANLGKTGSEIALPNLKNVFVGSGVQNIGSSSLGLGDCIYSVWFDTQNIDDLTIAADWYKSQCGSIVDGIIKRVIIRDGQDKAAWASKLGKEQDIIFYASEIQNTK